MTAASDCGSSPAAATCARTAAVQSGMFDPRHPPDRFHECFPPLPMGAEHSTSVRGEPIKAPPPLTRLLDPAPGNPAAAFQAVEERVQRSRVKPQRPLGPRLDELGDLVPVARSRLEQRQNQQL